MSMSALADWPRSVSDPVLGEVRLSEDVTWWEGSVTLEGKPVGFKIGGRGRPGPKLLEHAHEIVRSYPAFERMIAEFVAAEGRDVKSLRYFADEIRRLQIEDVCLF